MNNPLTFVAVALLLLSFITVIYGMIKNSAVIVGGGAIATNVVVLLILIMRFLR